jgi:hypothetical protein
MSVRIISHKRDARGISIKLVDGTLVKGKVNMSSDKACIQRVSEIFTHLTDPFLVVFDATYEGKGSQVMIVNKRNILWAAPED